MFEIMKWISVGMSLFSVCLASYSLWLSVKRNKQLARENWDLKAKYKLATQEIIRLQKMLDGKD